MREVSETGDDSIFAGVHAAGGSAVRTCQTDSSLS